MSTRYQRRSPLRRTSERVQREIPPLEFGTPFPTFRAAITGDIEGTYLKSYTRAGAGIMFLDTVFWDYWENGDSRFFDEFIQPSGPQQGLLGAVQLLIPGVYGIRASIDWDDIFTATNFRDQIGTNYDDSGTKVRYLHKDDYMGPLTIDQFRIFWPNWTSGQDFVEIVVGHDDTVSHTIPGNGHGYWGQPPYLEIYYLGGYSTDDMFFLEFA